MIDKKIVYERVGKNIQQYRDIAKITQEALASALDVSRASIANYESGKQSIYISDLYKVAEFLNISIYDLLPTLDDIKAKSAPEQLINTAKDLQEDERKEIKSFIKNLTEGGKDERKS